jgi:hypothetical protein
MSARASITAVVSTWEVWKADTVAGVQAVKWSVVLSMSTTVATRCYGIRYRAACESVTRRPVIWHFRSSAAVPPKVREAAADRLTTENAVEKFPCKVFRGEGQTGWMALRCFHALSIAWDWGVWSTSAHFPPDQPPRSQLCDKRDRRDRER